MGLRLRVLAAIALLGCGGSARQGAPLQVPRESVPPAIVAKISKDPFSYFRYINLEFSKEVCVRLEPIIGTFPPVNLHGDAHIQQFAVTDHSAGLVDFDDSVSGPPALDLVRFGTSLRLALQMRGWNERSSTAVKRFFESYRAALEACTLPPTPSVVRVLRESFTSSQVEFLAWAESQMEPVPESRRAQALAGYRRYVDLMLTLQDRWPREYFALKKWGDFSAAGIGSARGARLIARIEGPTESPDDDIILEAKEVRDLTEVPCLKTQRGDALRVISGSSSFNTRQDPFLAVIPRDASEDDDDPPWWIQSWTAQYGEVDIQETFADFEELMQVVEYAGAQLAIGHLRCVPDPYDRQLAVLIRGALDEHAARLHQLIDEMTERTRAAYSRFRLDE